MRKCQPHHYRHDHGEEEEEAGEEGFGGKRTLVPMTATTTFTNP